MEFKIEIEEEVYKTLHLIMNNIDDLNDGKELGAWLLGDYKVDKHICTLTLDGLVIPKQKVSTSEVDISPDSMIETIKEIGAENANRIKAHWHIHPFGKGETNWSSIDESKIEDFMSFDKGREVFCFLLSSEDLIFGRIELNLKSKSCFGDIMSKQSFDNLNVNKIGQNDSLRLEEIKKEIKEKVETSTVVYRHKDEFTNVSSDYYSSQLPIKVYTTRRDVRAKISDEFFDFIDNEYMGLQPIITGFKKRGSNVIVKFKDESMDNEELLGVVEDKLYSIYESWFGYKDN